MKRAVILGLLCSASLCAAKPAVAQDQSQPQPQAGNPLAGMFQIAPQYQSGNKVDVQPQSQDNPLKGLFAIPPQYQSGNSVNVQPPEGTSNHLENFMTNAAKYQSGVDVQPQPKFLDPTFIKDQIEKGYVPSPAEKQMVMDKFPDFYKKEEPPKAATPANQATQSAQGAAAEKGKEEKGAGKNKKSTDKKKKKKTEEAPAKPLVYDPLKAAVFLYQTGQYDKALGILAGQLKTNPTDSAAHYLRAITLAAQGSNKEAEDEYRQVIQLVPTSHLAQKAAEGLRKLGGDMPSPPSLPPLRTHQ